MYIQEYEDFICLFERMNCEAKEAKKKIKKNQYISAFPIPKMIFHM